MHGVSLSKYTHARHTQCTRTCALTHTYIQVSVALLERAWREAVSAAAAAAAAGEPEEALPPQVSWGGSGWGCIHVNRKCLLFLPSYPGLIKFGKGMYGYRWVSA
jgi:hypothetical protein